MGLFFLLFLCQWSVIAVLREDFDVPIVVSVFHAEQAVQLPQVFIAEGIDAPLKGSELKPLSKSRCDSLTPGVCFSLSIRVCVCRSGDDSGDS